jgi:hypothetical protein
VGNTVRPMPMPRRVRLAGSGTAAVAVSTDAEKVAVAPTLLRMKFPPVVAKDKPVICAGPDSGPIDVFRSYRELAKVEEFASIMKMVLESSFPEITPAKPRFPAIAPAPKL